MAEVALAERTPLAHRVVAGRHGRPEGDPGVTLRVLDGCSLTLLMARCTTGAEMRRAAAAVRIELPLAGRTTTAPGVAVMWSGPEQWLVFGEPAALASAERFVAACRPFCAIVDQSDARALIAVAGPQARGCLAKGFPIDLHPRAFGPGATAVTTAAGVAVQIWQAGERFTIAVPRSFAEGFWAWLTEAAAEYGVLVDG